MCRRSSMPPGRFEGDVSLATSSCAMSEHPRFDARPHDQPGARWPLTIRARHEDIRPIRICAKGFTRTVPLLWCRGSPHADAHGVGRDAGHAFLDILNRQDSTTCAETMPAPT